VRGKLIAHGSPESLLAAINGRVWEFVTSSDLLPALRQKHLVSNTVHRSDGVHVRVIADEPPDAVARPLEPSLEDAYLAALAAHRSGQEGREVIA